nr:IS21-like element helper ATPase IstB [Streptobacillus canis]
MEEFKNSDMSLVETLVKLTDYEIRHKENNLITAMIKIAGFPFKKEIDDFDFNYQENLNKQDILDLLSHRFIHNFENIIFIGPSGVGKTHLATSTGISTYFIKFNDLINQLNKASREGRFNERIKHYCKYRVLIIDELGYIPISKEESLMFFKLINDRYEKKSTIVTTNADFRDWGNIFSDNTLANVILDRLLDHCNVININGKSYRVRDYYQE